MSSSWFNIILIPSISNVEYFTIFNSTADTYSLLIPQCKKKQFANHTLSEVTAAIAIARFPEGYPITHILKKPYVNTGDDCLVVLSHILRFFRSLLRNYSPFLDGFVCLFSTANGCFDIHGNTSTIFLICFPLEGRLSRNKSSWWRYFLHVFVSFSRNFVSQKHWQQLLGRFLLFLFTKINLR